MELVVRVAEELVLVSSGHHHEKIEQRPIGAVADTWTEAGVRRSAGTAVGAGGEGCLALLDSASVSDTLGCTERAAWPSDSGVGGCLAAGCVVVEDRRQLWRRLRKRPGGQGGRRGRFSAVSTALVIPPHLLEPQLRFCSRHS